MSSENALKDPVWVGPLDGVTVVDFTQVLSGPFCTMLLADMGADVIRIEPVTSLHRSLGKPVVDADGSLYLMVNRNKKSVALDLKDPRCVEICYKLVESADVVVENFRPGVAEKLGLSWSRLSEINPKLIYASISGFGQTGRYAERPGYDLLVQAMSGLMSATGEPDGAPAKCGIPVSDVAAGLFASNAILGALIGRSSRSVGCHIDVALLDSAIALSFWEAAEVWFDNTVPRRLGSHHRGNAPYGAIRVADGHIVVGLNTDKFWHRFCEILELEFLIHNPHYATNSDRVRHREALLEAIEVKTTLYRADDLLQILIENSVPSAPIRDYMESLNDPNTRDRGMQVSVVDESLGPIKILGNPIKSTFPLVSIERPTSRQGHHTREILSAVGLSAGEIDDLLKDGSILG